MIKCLKLDNNNLIIECYSDNPDETIENFYINFSDDESESDYESESESDYESDHENDYEIDNYDNEEYLFVNY